MEESSFWLMQEDKLRWWTIYSDPEHESVGRVQLYINYTSSSDHLKVSVNSLLGKFLNLPYCKLKKTL